MSGTTLQLRGLDKRQMAQIAARARQLGITSGDYLKRLVEEDLNISHEAKTTSLAKLLGSGRKVDESEVDRLVDAAKTRYRRGALRKR